MSRLEGLTLEALRTRRLARAFFARDARVVARALVGSYLVHAPLDAAPRAVRLVETEAYRGPKDAACHARFGLTKRTRALLGPPAHAYVFLVYGMHECFNVVAGEEGRGHAVLLRAGEPVLGVAEGVRADGPGKLCRALALTRRHDAESLLGDTLFLSARIARPRIAVTARIGVGYAGAIAEAPWRFLDPSSSHVSRPPAKAVGLGGAKAAPAG